MRASMMSFVLLIGSLLPAAAQIAANTDRPGGDIDAAYVKNASECQSKCSQDPRCVAWTFVKQDRHCMLKNPAPKARSDNCCNSGVVLHVRKPQAPKLAKPPVPILAPAPAPTLAPKDHPEEGLDPQ